MTARAFTNRSTGAFTNTVLIGSRRAARELRTCSSGANAAGIMDSNGAAEIATLTAKCTTGGATGGTVSIGDVANSGIAGIDSTGSAGIGVAAAAGFDSASPESFITGMPWSRLISAAANGTNSATPLVRISDVTASAAGGNISLLLPGSFGHRISKAALPGATCR